MQCKNLIGAVIAGGFLTFASASADDGLKIDAGPDQAGSVNKPVYLSGSTNKPGSVGWSKVNGPGEVVFEKQRSAATTATFSMAGQYSLMLGGYDGDIVTDTVLVTVNP